VFENGKLKFFRNAFEPQIRWFNDLKKVLAFPEEAKGNKPAYFLYRGVFRNLEEKELMKTNRLRFDVTVIPPAKIGKERIKTFGHCHSIAKDCLTYPEVYQVIKGEAYYLLQSFEGERRVNRVVCIKAKEKDIVPILPNYGHVTINPSDQTLIMANWVYANLKSFYEPFERLRGACYYYFEGEEWVKNPNYETVPEIEFEKPNEWFRCFGLRKEFIYQWIRRIEKLKFLKHPSKFLQSF